MPSTSTQIFGQIATSTVALVLYGSLAAVYLPKLTFLFVLEFAGIWDLVSRLSTEDQTLPTRDVIITALPSAARLAVPDICAICRDDFEGPVILPCGHVYCRACIESWFESGRNSCPLDFRQLFKRSVSEGSISTFYKAARCAVLATSTVAWSWTFVLARFLAHEFMAKMEVWRNLAISTGWQLKVRNATGALLGLLVPGSCFAIALCLALLLTVLAVEIYREMRAIGPGWWRHLHVDEAQAACYYILWFLILLAMWLLESFVQSGVLWHA
ncbi:unnamed protein product [Zymoseptoria tritici ST99CH_1A5]|uniref:RING-type domain-containing protein n=1 Tax=Zymoseptoria tritici ST99CH_1A5 TaxID=1276529 RepID=A0A1Y6LUV2_ZYMTR|nr:unnamed protein product [Zymoseptoria tritici ST99CH_1A5]